MNQEVHKTGPPFPKIWIHLFDCLFQFVWIQVTSVNNVWISAILCLDSNGMDERLLLEICKKHIKIHHGFFNSFHWLLG